MFTVLFGCFFLIINLNLTYDFDIMPISILCMPIPPAVICVNNLGSKTALPFQFDYLYSFEQIHCNQLLLTFFCHRLAYMTAVQFLGV